MMVGRRVPSENLFLSPSLSRSPSIGLLPWAGDPRPGESQIEGDKVEEVEGPRVPPGQGNVTFCESPADSRVRAHARA
jgi:hypothetical protein